MAPRGSATRNVDRLGAAAPLRKADLHAADERGDRVVDRALLDAVILERLLIDREAQALGALAEAVVRIDDEIDRVEGLAHFRRRDRAASPRRVHRLRRAASTSTGGPGGTSTTLIAVCSGAGRPSSRLRISSAMAWLARLRSPFGCRLIARSPMLGRPAQIVMAHEAVEVERRGRAGIGLDRGQLGNVLEPLGRRRQHAIASLRAKRRAADRRRPQSPTCCRTAAASRARFWSRKAPCESSVATPTPIRNRLRPLSTRQQRRRDADDRNRPWRRVHAHDRRRRRAPARNACRRSSAAARA